MYIMFIAGIKIMKKSPYNDQLLPEYCNIFCLKALLIPKSLSYRAVPGLRANVF